MTDNIIPMNIDVDCMFCGTAFVTSDPRYFCWCLKCEATNPPGVGKVMTLQNELRELTRQNQQWAQHYENALLTNGENEARYNARIKELESEFACERKLCNHWQEQCEHLDARCAALREALEAYSDIIEGYCSEYSQPELVAPALSSDAGVALLKRLQAADAAAQATREQAMCDAWYAWRKAKGEV